MINKIAVIGASADGIAAAQRARRLDEKVQIDIYTPDLFFTFPNTLQDAADASILTAEQLRDWLNIQVHSGVTVTDINVTTQTIFGTDQRTQTAIKADYDYLFLATQMRPKRLPGFETTQQPNFFVAEGPSSWSSIKRYVTQNSAQQAVVLGGGYFALAAAQKLQAQGLQVTVVTAEAQILPKLDGDLAPVIHKEFLDQGLYLRLNTAVKQIEAHQVVFTDGQTCAADVIISALGVQPETTLAQKIGLTLGASGAVKVDHNFQTNLPHISVIGQGIEQAQAISGKNVWSKVAFQAHNQARNAVDHLFGRPAPQPGVLNSWAIPFYELTIGGTGLSEQMCQDLDINYLCATVIAKTTHQGQLARHTTFMKLIFRQPDGLLLGAQCIGEKQVSQQLDVLSIALQYQANVTDLPQLETTAEPFYGSTRSPLGMAALLAVDLLNGEVAEVSATQVRTLVASNATILDVREPGEFERGHIRSAQNMPMSQFRHRLAEIPRDHPVYVHCLTGQRGYYVARALKQLGFDNILSISGGIIGVSYNEYFRDQTLQRPPILDAYRFNFGN